MAIKDLAIAYNGNANADNALRVALQMSHAHDAEITALHVHAPLQTESRIARWASKEVLDKLRETDALAIEETENRFRDLIAAEGNGKSAEWLVETGPANEHLSRMARYHDLLLIGQCSEPGEKRSRVRAEDLVVRMGRPLLLVPADYQPRPFNGHAVVAWDGSRPASRALSDAMQILETEKRIDVVTVGTKPPADEGEAAELPIIRHLRRHGVSAERIFLEAGKDSVGRTILDYCKKADPDFLVMGAYNHARLREDLFGGVTHDILTRTTVPVLLSH